MTRLTTSTNSYLHGGCLVLVATCSTYIKTIVCSLLSVFHLCDISEKIQSEIGYFQNKIQLSVISHSHIGWTHAERRRHVIPPSHVIGTTSRRTPGFSHVIGISSPLRNRSAASPHCGNRIRQYMHVWSATNAGCCRGLQRVSERQLIRGVGAAALLFLAVTWLDLVVWFGGCYCLFLASRNVFCSCVFFTLFLEAEIGTMQTRLKIYLGLRHTSWWAGGQWWSLKRCLWAVWLCSTTTSKLVLAQESFWSCRFLCIIIIRQVVSPVLVSELQLHALFRPHQPCGFWDRSWYK